MELSTLLLGEFSPESVNVDESLSLGKVQMQHFEAGWPDSFYEPLSSKVVTMSISKKQIKLGSQDCYDTDLIYSRVMGLMSSREIDLKELFSHELAPVPTSMFEDNGDMRITKSKSALKQKLQVEQSSHTLSSPDTIIIDGGALLWIIQWPKQGIIQDFVNNVLEYVFRKLEHSDVYAIFDRYLQKDPPDLPPTEYGWEKDEATKALVPVTVAQGVELAPADVLRLTRCGCASDQPCSNGRCTCTTAQLSCTTFCACHGDEECCNKWTKTASTDVEARDSDVEDRGD